MVYNKLQWKVQAALHDTFIHIKKVWYTQTLSSSFNAISSSLLLSLEIFFLLFPHIFYLSFSPYIFSYDFSPHSFWFNSLSGSEWKEEILTDSWSSSYIIFITSIPYSVFFIFLPVFQSLFHSSLSLSVLFYSILSLFILLSLSSLLILRIDLSYYSFLILLLSLLQLFFHSSYLLFSLSLLPVSTWNILSLVPFSWNMKSGWKYCSFLSSFLWKGKGIEAKIFKGFQDHQLMMLLTLDSVQFNHGTNLLLLQLTKRAYFFFLYPL